MSTLHIFPSRATVEIFTRQVLRETGVVVGTTAFTLKDLTRKIGHGTLTGKRLLSPVGMKLLLGQVIHQARNASDIPFARISRFPGFSDAVQAVFGELKQAGVTPVLLSRHAAASADPAARELASLFTSYSNALCDKDLLDPHDFEAAAVARLAREPLPECLDGITAVCVHHIYDLSPLQLSLLSTLSRHMPVEIRLPYDPGIHDIYGYVARTADAVEALDDQQLNLNPVFHSLDGPFIAPLLHGSQFTNHTPPPFPGPMELMTAPGAYAECEEIGRRIRSLLEEGIDPADTAVLCRNLDRYGPMLEDVFRRFDIPLSFRRGGPIASAPLVRAVLSPFGLASSGFAREELVAFCASSYFSRPGGLPCPAEVDDVLSRAGYINEAFGAAIHKIDRLISTMEAMDRTCLVEKRVLCQLRPILTTVGLFRGNNSVSGFIKLLESFVEDYGIYRRGIDAHDDRALKRDASAIMQFQKVLANLSTDSSLLGLDNMVMSPAEFLHLLHQGMDGVFLAGEKTSGVPVLNFHDARGRTFDHVYIAGLNEDICPQRHDSHPLLTDTEKVLLRRRLGIHSLRTAKEKGEEEPLLFWMAVSTAEKSLTLSCCYADSRGNELLRTPFLEEILDRVPLKEKKIPVTRVTVEPGECREREELLNSLAQRGILDPATGAEELKESLTRIAENSAVEAAREAFFFADELSARRTLATSHTGLLSSPDITTSLAEHYSSEKGRVFSPTSLEEYGACPFRYFLRRLLRLAPADEPLLEPEAREVGSLAHLVLKDFFDRMQTEGRLPLTEPDVAVGVLREVAVGVFRQWETDHPPAEPLLWEREKETLLLLLEQMVTREAEECSPFVPCAFEHSIDPPLILRDESGVSVEIAGTIDRVDICKESRKLRVVDYKLAGDRSRYQQLLKKEALGETSFQVPVYLLAALRDFFPADASPEMAARFWLLRKGDPLDKAYADGPKESYSGFFSSDQSRRDGDGKDCFLSRLFRKVEAIKKGDFCVTPRQCGVCDFSTVCRFMEVNLRDGSETAPATDEDG